MISFKIYSNKMKQPFRSDGPSQDDAPNQSAPVEEPAIL